MAQMLSALHLVFWKALVAIRIYKKFIKQYNFINEILEDNICWLLKKVQLKVNASQVDYKLVVLLWMFSLFLPIIKFNYIICLVCMYVTSLS